MNRRTLSFVLIQLLPNTTDLRETFSNVIYQALADAPAPGTDAR